MRTRSCSVAVFVGLALLPTAPACGGGMRASHAFESAEQIGCATNVVVVSNDSPSEWTARCGPDAPPFHCSSTTSATVCNPELRDVAYSYGAKPASPPPPRRPAPAPAAAVPSAEPATGRAAAARNRAAAELACPPSEVHLETVLAQGSATTFRVEACGQSAVYTCPEVDCSMCGWCARER